MPLTSRAAVIEQLIGIDPAITRIEGQTQAPRDIANSDTVSEHSFGNALDIYGSLDALARAAKALDGARARHQIATLCYDPDKGPSYDRCTTRHKSHLHVDFSPKCGGHVSTTGSAQQLTAGCEAYQQGTAGGTVIQEEQEGDGLFGLAGIADDIAGVLKTGLLIVVGVALGVAGLTIMLKDTKVVKVATGAVTKAVTKGAI